MFPTSSCFDAIATVSLSMQNPTSFASFKVYDDTGDLTISETLHANPNELNTMIPFTTCLELDRCYFVYLEGLSSSFEVTYQGSLVRSGSLGFEYLVPVGSCPCENQNKLFMFSDDGDDLQIYESG